MGNDYYKDYDSSVASTHDWRTVHECLPYMEEYLTGSKNLRILDVGCGPGSITFDVFENYGDANVVVGLDTPPELIQEGKSRYCGGKDSIVNTTNHNELSFVEGSAYELPFKDGEFDIVYCHQVLIHLKDPAAALKEMQRVLVGKNGAAKASSAYLFICEAEMRSFFVYPLAYQPAITDYFKLAKSQYTKEGFGLSLLELFRSSIDDKSRQPKNISLKTVSWCISEVATKKHFASMYTKRIASRKDISDLQRYLDAWTNWLQDPISAAALMSGFLTVIY